MRVRLLSAACLLVCVGVAAVFVARALPLRAAEPQAAASTAPTSQAAAPNDTAAQDAAPAAASEGPALPPWLANKKDGPIFSAKPNYKPSREEILELVESVELELKLLRAAIEAQQ